VASVSGWVPLSFPTCIVVLIFAKGERNEGAGIRCEIATELSVSSHKDLAKVSELLFRSWIKLQADMVVSILNSVELGVAPLLLG